ncbi:adenylyl-sulfate kinase [Desulfonatronum lacustre]|uniref:adenylyl-sulfate kinase n=1 Tax=Desulfonatronum lacustre TaxID=66849 RepID=UPI0004B78F94|nr:adenylyl-sulfate kinase [Desulfonatronum lacustre]
MNTPCPNTVPYRGGITRERRERLLKQKSMVLWFTGLSGSGKSTIAHAVEERLHAAERLTYVFDGDNVRQGLCSDLSFSPEGRAENLRRTIRDGQAFFGRRDHLHDRVHFSLARRPGAMQAAYRRRTVFRGLRQCPLKVCEERDVKGLYKLARQGKIKNYTGISAPYEEPNNPDLVLETDNCSLNECVQQVMEFIAART